MKERGIIFNTEMIRALLDSRKTQTRRVVNPQRSKIFWNPVVLNGHGGWCDDHGAPVRCPYGKPGDRLYVRETWFEDFDPSVGHSEYFYKADWDFKPVVKWKPSIHMPKDAARIWLEIADIRVERVQDIPKEDAISEGLYKQEKWDGAPGFGYYMGWWYKNYQAAGMIDCPMASFKTLWNSINEERGYGWDKNPWVWVVEFRVIDREVGK